LVNIAVAPFVGVWVEIIDVCIDFMYNKSLPSWECGLKSILKGEIDYNLHRRSLRGSVG